MRRARAFRKADAVVRFWSANCRAASPRRRAQRRVVVEGLQRRDPRVGIVAMQTSPVTPSKTLAPGSPTAETIDGTPTAAASTKRIWLLQRLKGQSASGTICTLKRASSFGRSGHGTAFRYWTRSPKSARSDSGCSIRPMQWNSAAGLARRKRSTAGRATARSASWVCEPDA